LIAINGLCFLGLRECMTFENTSFPTPLSPEINTVKSVGATRTAVFSALSNDAETPRIPNFSFMLCNVIFKYYWMIVPKRVAVVLEVI